MFWGPETGQEDWDACIKVLKDYCDLLNGTTDEDTLDEGKWS